MSFFKQVVFLVCDFIFESCSKVPTIFESVNFIKKILIKGEIGLYQFGEEQVRLPWGVHQDTMNLYNVSFE